MADGEYRIGIVGASSLLGKEVADALSDSLFGTADLVLFDDEELIGQMTAAGDEVAFIHRLEADSFNAMDFVFFTGSADVAKAQWERARQAGVSIIDLTYALEREKHVLVLAPWTEEALSMEASQQVAPTRKLPDLRTPAVVVAHPAAVVLSLVAARLKAVGVKAIAATVMEPASEHGRLTMDELHQQTVNLLSFQPLPKEQYDAQIAFNLLPALGQAAKILSTTERRIAEQYRMIGVDLLAELAVRLVHVPVFHGYVASVLIDLGKPVSVEQVEAALIGAHINVVATGRGQMDPPSNLNAAGQEDILVQVTAAGDTGTRFWLWLAADNLKLGAMNAVACALELRSLRPLGKVQ